MKELSAGKLIFKNSRFFGHLYQVDSKNEIKIILNSQIKMYNKANHHCYAVFFYYNEKSLSYYKNDGEVGYPGKILLELLKKYNLNKNIIIVSRIFGGIKLGVGGVSKSFRDIGESIIKLHLSK